MFVNKKGFLTLQILFEV